MKKETISETAEKLVKYIKTLTKDNYHGKIEINFSAGKVTHWSAKEIFKG